MQSKKDGTDFEAPFRIVAIVDETVYVLYAGYEMLDDAGMEYIKSIFSANRVKVTDIQAVIENGWFDKGYCSLQDESAALPVELLEINDSDIVLDICSAPGGKLTQILEEEKKDILLFALDIDINRLKQVKRNVQRLKKKNVFFVAADGTALPLKPVFSKVLLDAPCSGLGVIRKHPDIKWRRTMDEILEFSRLQQALINEAGEILRKKGRLVYSTCTLEPHENNNVTAFFQEQNRNDFRPIKPGDKFKHLSKDEYIQTFPQRDDMDGAYCALLEKIS
jgi:16S rRNA (cytosine967-C5)-methyltransferase